MIVRARRPESSVGDPFGRRLFTAEPIARAAAAIVVLAALGCSRDDGGRASADPASSSAPKAAATATGTAASATNPDGGSNVSGGRAGSLVLARGLRFVKPAAGDAAKVVKAEREKAAADGRDVVVYVGATWCEPCQRFHHAAQAGELDADFPGLTIVEFDLDQDRDRLVDAGYESKLIPLFVVPGADGRATERRFEGSVKGDRAVTNIAPRLRAILAK